MNGCINWRENKWSTFAGYLKWYNDLDVTPLTSAIDSMDKFYKEKKIDFIHQAISLPGISMRVCHDSVTDPKAEFHLFNNKNKDIYKLFRRVTFLSPKMFSQSTRISTN